MNSRPMILRFCSGSVTPASSPRKRSLGVDDAQVGLEGVAEQRLDLRRLARAQQAVVDEDAGQARRRSPCSTSAAATDESTPPDRPQTTRPCVADLRADRRDRLARRSRPSSSSARSRRCGTGSSPGSRRRAACARPRGGTARRRSCAPAPPPPPPGSWRSRRRPRSRRGSASTRSPCDIQTGDLLAGGEAVEQIAGARSRCTRRAAVLALARPATTSPPSS